MAKTSEDGKGESLREWGALYAGAADVTDELFRAREFFDPRDLVQVKYEMLRRAQHEGVSVSEAARRFGFSRQAFYQARAIFQKHGLPVLVPSRPGPTRVHKLSRDVMAVVRERLAADDSLRSADLAASIAERFGLSVHPRSVERALARRVKKGR